MTGPWRERRARHCFLTHVRVRWHEEDALGHVNNANYLHYLEQAAIDHAAAAGFDVGTLRTMGGLFIARKHEIEFLRPAHSGDWLRVITWPESLGAARAIRCYWIVRLETDELAGESPKDRLVIPEHVPEPNPTAVLVKARTEWAFVVPESGRPRRIPDVVTAEFLRSD